MYHAKPGEFFFLLKPELHCLYTSQMAHQATVHCNITIQPRLKAELLIAITNHRGIRGFVFLGSEVQKKINCVHVNCSVCGSVIFFLRKFNMRYPISITKIAQLHEQNIREYNGSKVNKMPGVNLHYYKNCNVLYMYEE